ncbi:MAG: glycosyltransferase family 2 protein [Bacteroidetes bacterium]|nr:glycosyltransferase family 2 protein [Bacteroidota bacterium]
MKSKTTVTEDLINIKEKPSVSYKEEDYEILFNAVRNYEERIKKIEDSPYWKMYLFFTKTKLILTSDSYLKGDKWKFFQRLRFLLSRHGLFLIGKFFKQLFKLIFGRVNILIGFGKGYEPINYETFKQKNFPRLSDIELMQDNIKRFDIKPYFDIVVLIDRNNFKHINHFLKGLEQQVYTDYRIIFSVEDPSEIMHFTLKKVTDSDSRFILSENNIRESLGEPNVNKYIMFTKLDCILSIHCLYHFANSINNNPESDFFYCDNDFFDKNNTEVTENPYFKPDWSPHTLLSRNYIGDLFTISSSLYSRTSLQSERNIYSLVLNLTQNSYKVSHIQKILYHKNFKSKTSEEIRENHIALNHFLARYYENSYAKLSETALGCFSPIFKLKKDIRVSIIIPAKNKSGVLQDCIDSILNNSTYQNYEIIVVDNGSTEKSFLTTLAQYEYNYPHKIRSLRLDIPFNYSILNNKASKIAEGDYLLFLNNDTKIISQNIIEEMLKYAQLENAGAVGAKLLYPNNTIQHAGIILSLDETGAHVYSGAHKDTSGYYNNANCITNYGAVTGACMMVSKEKFELVGGFDENLAVDCNDVDLCCKLYTVGYFNIYLPHVSMYHYECLTRGNPMLRPQAMAHQSNEKNYLINKWDSMIKNDPFYNDNLTRISKNYELKNA